MTESSIAERVRRGAEWLDREMPDWLDMIDLPQLKMNDCCGCVLGQTFGDYWDVAMNEVGDDDENKAHRGFQAYSMLAVEPSRDAWEAEYAALAAEWSRVITARREASNG